MRSLSTAGSRRLLFLCGVLALAVVSTAGAADWPRYRGPGGSGVSADGIVTWPPAELWNASIGTGYSSIVSQGGRVYAVGHVEIADGRGTDTVYCFDAASTGTDPAPLWTYSYGCGSFSASGFGGLDTAVPGGLSEAGPRATPVTDGASVYVLSLDGFLFCLDAVTGDVVWCRNVEGHLGGKVKTYGCCSSPVLHDDMLFLDIDGTCIALEKATGEVLWRQAAGGGWACTVSPVVTTYGSTTAVVFGSGSVAGADVTDGSLLWKYAMGREAMSSHVVSNDKVFFSTYPNSGRSALLTVSGTSPVKVWETPNVMTYHLTNVLYGDYLYVMDNSLTEWEGHDGGDDDADAFDSSLKCLDLATGTVEWTKAGLGWATHVVAGDELVILKESGELLRVDATESAYQETGAVTGLIGTWCWTSPALAEGKLYCRNSEGDLVCLELAPAVSVEATDSLALETSDTATFTVSRAAVDVTAALTVSIALSGTGAKDTHYTLAGGGVTQTSVTIPAGEPSVDVTLTPLAHADTDDKTVTLTISQGTGYVVASRSSATAHILDEAMSPQAVSVMATDAWALEGGPGTGSFTFTRSSGDSWPLVVGISVGGTAQADDFALRGAGGGEVVIPSGATTAVVTLHAGVDANTTDDTVTVTVSAGSAFYTVGSPSNATITIADVDSAATDLDGDGMDDEWEKCWWGDTSQSADGDPDADGLSNFEEYGLGTDPTAADTDRDGSTDGDEVAAGANPKSPVSYPPPASSGGGGGGCAVGDGLSSGVIALAFLGLAAAALALALRMLGRPSSSGT